MDARSNEDIIARALFDACEEAGEYPDFYEDGTGTGRYVDSIVAALSAAGRHIVAEGEAMIDGQRGRLVAAQRYLWSEIEAAPCWEGWGHGDDEPLFRVVPSQPVVPTTDGPEDK